MLSTLLDRKRRDQDAPRNYGQLQILMDMMKLVKNDGGNRRLSHKQDVPTVVPIPPKHIVTVEISDDEKAEEVRLDDAVSSEDDLERKLFGSKSSTSATATPGAVPLTASALAELAACPPTGPSPQECASTNKTKKDKTKPSVPLHSSADEGSEDGQEQHVHVAKGKRKKRKGKGKGKRKAPSTAKRKTPAKSKVDATESAVDPIANYIGIKGVRLSVLRNRVYSKAHAMEKKYRLGTGWSRETALESAAKYANKQVSRWLKAIGEDK
jgi:hypothetical protein